MTSNETVMRNFPCDLMTFFSLSMTFAVVCTSDVKNQAVTAFIKSPRSSCSCRLVSSSLWSCFFSFCRLVMDYLSPPPKKHLKEYIFLMITENGHHHYHRHHQTEVEATNFGVGLYSRMYHTRENRITIVVSQYFDAEVSSLSSRSGIVLLNSLRWQW